MSEQPKSNAGRKFTKSERRDRLEIIRDLMVEGKTTMDIWHELTDRHGIRISLAQITKDVGDINKIWKNELMAPDISNTLSKVFMVGISEFHKIRKECWEIMKSNIPYTVKVNVLKVMVANNVAYVNTGLNSMNLPGFIKMRNELKDIIEEYNLKAGDSSGLDLINEDNNDEFMQDVPEEILQKDPNYIKKKKTIELTAN